MNISKLFGVLVVGGALLTAGCTSDEDDRADATTAQVGAKDGGQAATDGAAATPDASNAELESCGFCPNECCVYDDDGNGAAMEGFECCWGTSC